MLSTGLFPVFACVLKKGTRLTIGILTDKSNLIFPANRELGCFALPIGSHRRAVVLPLQPRLAGACGPSGSG
jgi:hypothetical protein